MAKKKKRRAKKITAAPKDKRTKRRRAPGRAPAPAPARAHVIEFCTRGKRPKFFYLDARGKTTSSRARARRFGRIAEALAEARAFKMPATFHYGRVVPA